MKEQLRNCPDKKGFWFCPWEIALTWCGYNQEEVVNDVAPAAPDFIQGSLFSSLSPFLSHLALGVERAEEKGQRKVEERRIHKVAKDKLVNLALPLDLCVLRPPHFPHTLPAKFVQGLSVLGFPGVWLPRPLPLFYHLSFWALFRLIFLYSVNSSSHRTRETQGGNSRYNSRWHEQITRVQKQKNRYLKERVGGEY